MRRAGFGGTKAEIDALMTRPTWASVVDKVLDTTANPVDTIPSGVDRTDDQFYLPWIASVQYWVDRMITTPTPIVEKMTLFWHGHLTSSSDVVLPRLMHRQIKTWRANALGDLHSLLQAMPVDPAMLKYLNNASNVARLPNENFARELMELFTLGNGQFTEAEVVAMARAWTGHNLSADGETYAWVPADHDTGTKTLFGIAKNWNGPDTITEIVRGARQQQCAAFLARKVWSFFAYPDPAPAIVSGLAADFVASGMNIKALVRSVFLRPEFRLPATRSALVRSPIEWLVASMRITGLMSAKVHPEWFLESLGQKMYAPPNVAGWRQNQGWISTSAQWSKGAFTAYLRWIANDAGVLAGADRLSPPAAVDYAFETFGVDDPSPLTRQRMEDYVVNEQIAGRRWTIAPNLVALTMLSPDFQLA